MLQPKRTKFRKAHKGRIHGIATSGDRRWISAQFGLKAIEPERVTARQIEAARRAHHAPHEARRSGLDPHLPGRAGDARSRPKCAWARARARRIVGRRASSRAASCSSSTACRCEVAKEALALAAAKLPIKTRFVERIAE